MFSNRGDGGDGDGTDSEGDDYWESSLGNRVGKNLGKMASKMESIVTSSHEDHSDNDIPDDEESLMKKAIAESLKTKECDDQKRGRGMGVPEEFKLFADVISEDEDDEAKGAGVKKRFATSARGSKAKTTSVRGAKTQGGTAKSTASKGQSLTKSRQPQSKAIGSSQSGASSLFPLKEEATWSAELAGLSTTPKPGGKSFTEAAGSSTAKKSVTKKHPESKEPDDTKDSLAKEVPPGMRFNPFTFCFEPKPNFKRLETLAPPETINPIRVLTPHDFELDNDGNELKTPEEKVRAYKAYMDEEERKIRQHNQHLPTRPSKTVTYHEGECLGTKSRNMKGDTPLSKWFEETFPGGIDDEQRKWMTEFRAHNKEVAERKKKEAEASGETSGKCD